MKSFKIGNIEINLPITQGGMGVDVSLSGLASAVQMGTLFVTTDECDASEEFKKVYIKACKEDIRIIKSPVGMPGRAINGEFIDRVEAGLETPQSCPVHCIKTCDYTKSPYCIMSALFSAARGNMKKGYAFAGVNAHLAERIKSVKEVVSLLKEEFATVQQRCDWGKMVGE